MSTTFTAKEVQSLRQITGAGMMDCKKALQENDGDIENAKQWLREQGLAANAKRDDRDNTQGLIGLSIKGSVGAMVHLKCETDFVASSEGFTAESDALLALVIASGPEAIAQRNQQLEDLKITLKEKIEIGRVVHMDAAAGNILDSYIHIQGGRGVNGVMVEMSGASSDIAHEVAVHIAFARPQYLNRQDIPQEVIDKERATLEVLTRNEGKPEQAIAKVVEGRMNGFYKDVVLLEQSWAKDDKQSIAQLIGAGTIIRFAQVEIG